MGAPEEDSNRGAIYAINIASGFTGELPFAFQRTASPAPAGVLGFGRTLSISGTRVVVGSQGNYAYVYNRSGSTWSTSAANTLTGTGDFGIAVDIDRSNANLLVVGAPTAASNGVCSVYRWTGAAWSKVDIAPLSGQTYFGISVSVSGERIAIAAMDGGTANLVKASYSGGVWSRSTQIVSTTPTVFAVGYDIELQPWASVVRDPLGGNEDVLSLGMPNGRIGVSITRYGSVLTTPVSLGQSWQGSCPSVPAGAPCTVRVGRVVAGDDRTLLVGSSRDSLGRISISAIRLSNGDSCSANSDCASTFCVDGVCCDTACGGGSTVDCQACSTASGTSVNGTCGPLSASVAPTVYCRFPTGPCDVSEMCVAGSTTCPTDTFRPNTYVCNSSVTGPCDTADRCTGSSAACPATYLPSSTTCRAAAGGCDVAEMCTGSSAACPADTLRVAGTVCQPAAGECDIAETCSGSSTACPANVRRPSGYTCRASAGVCDPAETCNGTADACPTNALLTGNTCRASTGLCDQEEKCDGLDPVCPNDLYASPGTVCRAVNPSNACDSVEVCSGAATTCPSDASAAACFVPPSSDLVAPPIDHSAGATFGDSIEFLYQGSSPVQTGVAPGTIVEERASALFGYVSKRDASSSTGTSPLAGVTVRVLDHPEFGSTLTRANGRFDLVVNGGDAQVVVFEKSGYIPSQRTAPTHWSAFDAVDPVVMVPYEPGTLVQLPTGTSMPVQVVRGLVHGTGATLDDNEGYRQATLLFMPGTTAQAEFASSSPVQLTNLNVRATEFTVGAAGPDAMPGNLPLSVGYTYAVEFSVDEAIAAGASNVRFNQPVRFYLENFIDGVPVGHGVPTGYYDRQRGQWVPSETGRVIKVLSESGSPLVANLDLNGDGLADSSANMNALGIDDLERQKLAELYAPGQELWRVKVDHFTPWDSNWPWGPPDGATGPELNIAQPENTRDCEYVGSIIRCESQTLGETVPVAGTDLSLRYSSERSPGRRDEGRRRIEFSIDPPPIALKSRVHITLAGRKMVFEYPAIPRRFIYDWDGLDAYGRVSDGFINAQIKLCFDYTPTYGTYANFERFGRFMMSSAVGNGGGSASSAIVRLAPPPITICSPTRNLVLGTRRNLVDGIFGWEIDQVHHRLPNGEVLRGDGVHVASAGEETLGAVTTLIDPSGTVVSPSSGQSLTNWPAWFNPSAIAVESDGSLLVANRQRNSSGIAYTTLSRVSPQGLVSTVAGVDCGGCGGLAATILASDDTPAHAAVLADEIVDIAVRSDRIYLLEAISGEYIVRRIDSNGLIRRVAGSGSYADSPDGGAARDTRLQYGQGIAVSADGSLYVLETPSGPFSAVSRVRHVASDGSMTTVINGSAEDDPTRDSICRLESWPRGQALNASPTAITVSQRGDLYIALHDYRAVDLGGSISRAGNCVVQLLPDGNMRRITGTSGAVTRESGASAFSYDADRIDAIVASDEAVFLRERADLVAIEEGAVFSVISDPNRPMRARTTGQPDAFKNQVGLMPGLGGNDIIGQRMALLPSGAVIVNTIGVGAGAEDPKWGIHRIDQARRGLFVLNGETWEFDPFGRHRRTRSLLTNSVTRELTRNSAGVLTAIADASNNSLQIQRSAGLVRLVPPFGPVTEVRDTNGDGWADSITYAGTSRTWNFSSTSSGLLTTAVEPDGQSHHFDYDTLGRLVRDTPPGHHYATLTAQPSVQDEAGITRTVQYRTRSNRTTTHVTASRFDGSEHRTVTRPDGSIVATERSTPSLVETGSAFVGVFARNETLVDATGSTTTTTFHLDEHARSWDDAVPASTVFTTPGSRVLSTSRSRERTYQPGSTTIATESAAQTIMGSDGSIAASSSTFDVATRALTSTSPLGRTAQTKFDTHDRVIEIRTPGSVPTHIEYDARGRIARIWKQSGSVLREQVFGYVDASVGETWSPATITDPDGTTTIDWTSMFQIGSVSRDGQGTVTYAWESAFSDRLTGISPPSRPAHTSTWAPGGRERSYAPPALTGYSATDPVMNDTAPAATTYHRDVDGNVDRITLGDTDGSPDITTVADRVIDFTRMPDGRMQTISQGTRSVTFGYDATTKQLKSLTTEGPTPEVTTITEDGPLLMSAAWTGPVAGTVAFDYDGLFRRNQVTVGAVQTRYAFDEDGAVECITTDGSTPSDPCSNGFDVELTLAQPQSQLTTSIGPSPQVQSSLVWNELGELVSQGYTRGASTLFRDLITVRDDIGRITARTETVEGVATNITYAYDNLGRLIDVTRGGTNTEHYEYDANGNRTLVTANGVTLASAAAGTILVDARDRLRRYGNQRYFYNSVGQLTSKDTGASTPPTTYSYDALGALRQVVIATSGSVIEYVIDGAGRRVGRKVNGTFDRKWIYLDDLRPIAEYTGTGTLSRVFIYGTGRVPDLMVIPAGQPSAGTYRIISDRLGSVRRVVNVATGAIEQRLDYDSFGRVLNNTAPGFQPFGFAGGLYDSTTRLVRFGARDYDADIGRWTAPDPIRFAGGDSNLYAYVGSDPVHLTDSTGLEIDAGDVADFLDNWGFDDFWAGVGDAVTGLPFTDLSLTRGIREWTGTNGSVDACSGAYMGGQLAGAMLVSSIHSEGFHRGYEFRFGRTRIAPWGNRTGNPYGEWPHYHRSRPHTNPRRAGAGESAPGQGIGRHRPWEGRADYDRSFWDRF